MKTRSHIQIGALSAVVVTALTNCAPSYIATNRAERAGCTNVPGLVRIGLAATPSPALARAGLGEASVEVRSKNGPPIEGALAFVGTAPPDLAADTSDTRGRAVLRFRPGSQRLEVRRLGYVREQLTFAFRVGYVDTVQVWLQCGVPMS